VSFLRALDADTVGEWSTTPRGAGNSASARVASANSPLLRAVEICHASTRRRAALAPHRPFGLDGGNGTLGDGLSAQKLVEAELRPPFLTLFAVGRAKLARLYARIVAHDPHVYRTLP